MHTREANSRRAPRSRCRTERPSPRMFMDAPPSSTPGIITNQVIQEVINAPMAVADLTGYDANACYELAVRHMVKKPLVQMITKGEKIPSRRLRRPGAPLRRTRPRDCREDHGRSLSSTSDPQKAGPAGRTIPSRSRLISRRSRPAQIPSGLNSVSLRPQ